MELLIAGGIALLGFGMSTPGRGQRLTKRPKYAKQLGPSNEYIEPGNSTKALDRDYTERAEKRWRESRDPGLTGIVTPHTKLTNAQLPFFTSAKTQNTNDGVKQTLLETFTGANSMDTSLTGTYRNKREVEAMFTPSYSAQEVTSSGSSGNKMYDRQDVRYENSAWQNNVLPAEKIYVGRGIGVGPDVAAADGFHPMHRVVLKNVGEYKKNNLPGGVNHGASYVNKSTKQAKVAVNHNPGSMVYDQNRRPMMPSMAAVHAPKVHPQLAQDPNIRPKPVDLDRFGNPGRAGHEARGFKETRIGYECGGDHYDRNHSLPRVNPTGAVSAVGAFTHSAFDHSRIEAQQREEVARSGFVSGPQARQLPSGHLLPTTQREMSGPAPAGGVGVIRSGGAIRKMDKTRTTLRDTQGVNTLLTGAKAAVQGGMLDNVWRYKRLDREAKRGDQLVAQPVLAGRMNVMAGTEGIGAMAQRDRDVRHQPAAPFMPSLPNKGYQEGLGKITTPHNKLPMANPRLDLGYATDQLRSNPYAQSLWEAA